MPLICVVEPFDHAAWILELKHDGFRPLAKAGLAAPVRVHTGPHTQDRVRLFAIKGGYTCAMDELEFVDDVTSIDAHMASQEFESAALSERLARIHRLTDELLKLQATSQEARTLAERIHHEIHAARDLLRPSSARPE